MKKDLVLGVLGGMGPDATVNFMDEIVSRTPTDRDQDHIEMIVYNDPKVPDRNQAILNGSKTPVPRLKRNVQRLESSGADVIAIPCNTVHYYYDELAESVDVDILHILQESKTEIQRHDIDTVGLLSTSTVIEVELYRDEFEDVDIDVLHPENSDYLMDAIYSIKKGDYKKAQKLVDEVVNDLTRRNIDGLIVGCSDLSLLTIKTELPTFDPTNILAEACIQRVTERNLGTSQPI